MATPSITCPSCDVDLEPDDILKYSGQNAFKCNFCEEEMPYDKKDAARKIWEKGSKDYV